MKHTLLALLLLFGVTSAVLAGDFEDGKDALAHKDFATAFQKFLNAAEAGHTKAQYMLGVSYAYGKGVSQNDVQAYKWFHIAAATSTDHKVRVLAVNSRDALAQTMSPHEIAEAEQLARDWHGT
ncbi:MAG: hypothetical protein CMH81_01700 [Nitrospiraceae bacterium]|nr:hypothetical protein [Nitrospiraceae bacterium]|tara:strand:- start:3764 stop:4135 length:372 start_codon:yes stop_codon:yes gene_type:complete